MGRMPNRCTSAEGAPWGTIFVWVEAVVDKALMVISVILFKSIIAGRKDWRFCQNASPQGINAHLEHKDYTPDRWDWIDGKCGGGGNCGACIPLPLRERVAHEVGRVRGLPLTPSSVILRMTPSPARGEGSKLITQQSPRNLQPLSSPRGTTPANAAGWRVALYLPH